MLFEHDYLKRKCLDQVEGLSARLMKLLAPHQALLSCSLVVGNLHAHSKIENKNSFPVKKNFQLPLVCEGEEWLLKLELGSSSQEFHQLPEAMLECFSAWLWKKHFEYCAPLVFKDDLTNVYNYRKLVYDLQKLLQENNLKDNPTPFSLIFMDIDDLKKINNKYGHRTGSQLIRDLATAVVTDISSEYSIYRYGGDEFILLVEGKNPELVIQELEKIQDGLDNKHFVIPNGMKLKLSFSLGVVQYPQHGISLEELIDLADSMMYHAKKVGGKKILTPDAIKFKTA
ncbi:MAG: GGDEF domain-containing protein [Bacteriovoracaceae bacterium]|nr:GGDEF domain-containing protein [Bacteriovoracaceae bacterium]